MRFDPNRVIDRAARFEAARPEHSPAMRRAVEEARQALVGAGWNVEVIPVGPRWTGRRHALAGTLIVATFLALGSLLVGLMKDQDVWIAGALSAVLFLGLTLVHVARWRWDRNREQRDPSVHLLATVLPARPRSGRLVILADSHTRDVGRGRRWLIRMLLGAGLLSVVVQLAGSRDAVPRSWGLVAVMGAVVLTTTTILALGLLSEGEPGGVSGGTGLAMLVELAACLPRSARERLDVWFVVTSRCGHLVNAVGSRLGAGRPTYVLALSDPGCGMPIVAGVGDAAELAADAATSLQLPFRRRWTGAKLLRPFARMAMPGVLIGGEGRDAPDPARLRAVEHLVAEFSLRWARRATQTGGTPPAS